MNTLTESELIKKCQNGELESFGEIYEIYVEKIYNFIFFRVSHKETAEDLTSQVFMKALDHISDFKNDLGFFSAWIYKISRNTIIDHYRTKKNVVNIDDEINLKSTDNLEDELDIKYNLQKVEKYIKDLKPSQKEILIMRIWDGLSYKEIAKIVGKSEENCKVIFSRVMSQVRKESIIAFIILLTKMIFK